MTVIRRKKYVFVCQRSNSAAYFNPVNTEGPPNTNTQPNASATTVNPAATENVVNINTQLNVYTMQTPIVRFANMQAITNIIASIAQASSINNLAVLFNLNMWQQDLSSALVSIHTSRAQRAIAPIQVLSRCFGRRSRFSSAGAVCNTGYFTRCPYNIKQANFQSKLAMALLTNVFAKKIRGVTFKGIVIYSVPSHVICTELQKHLDKTGFSTSSSMLRMLFAYLLHTRGRESNTIVYCAVDERNRKVIGLYSGECQRVNRQITNNERVEGNVSKSVDLQINTLF